MEEQMKALIIGATGGIGQAITSFFHSRGVELVISGRNQEMLRMMSEEFDIQHIACDITASVVEVQTLVDRAYDMLSGLDILVYSAGIIKDQLMIRMSYQDWYDVIHANLNAAFITNQAACKIMMKNRFGRIINIGSIVGKTGNPGQVNYTASKAGMVGMTKTIAREYAGRGITANCVAPGFINTKMTQSISKKRAEKIIDSIPMGRYGTPEEVAALVMFLASKESSYLTGQVINIDGGIT